jgi:hypothetical protein
MRGAIIGGLGLIAAISPVQAQQRVIVSPAQMAAPSDELAIALFACQARFSGSAVFCDAIAGGACHYQYTVPACYEIERRWNAPGGEAEQIARADKAGEAADRALIERLAK